MKLQHRIGLLTRLGDYILSSEPAWLDAKKKAEFENGWFTPEFTDLACSQIANNYLKQSILENWTKEVREPATPRHVGIIMAGNIPLVGFHDWLCVFVSGHIARIRFSSKDKVLLTHLLDKMNEWDPAVATQTRIEEMLKGCDAYIATGSNNSARYFEYYFGKYPHIIRRNRTAVGILTGNERQNELEKLADDVYQYFGLGCRNVTKIYVPRNFDFVPLLAAFRKYDHLANHHKYKNNYDYNLALHLLNHVQYMANDSILMIEQQNLFSPISQLNYEYYEDRSAVLQALQGSPDIQCIVGDGQVPFGQAQQPAIDDYADGVNTLAFLGTL